MKKKRISKKHIIDMALYIILPSIVFGIFYLTSTMPSYWLESLSYKQHVASEKTYEWYLDQQGTGAKSNTNCAPTSIAMAAKWQDESFDTSVSEIRNRYSHVTPDGMTVKEVKTALHGLNVKYNTKTIFDYDDLVDVIDSNQIAIVFVDLKMLSFNDDRHSAVGKYYTQGFNHAIVIKGYLYLKDVLYYQVYDPYQGIKVYPNNQPKGYDRLYSSKEVYSAMKAFDSEYCIIQVIK